MGLPRCRGPIRRIATCAMGMRMASCASSRVFERSPAVDLLLYGSLRAIVSHPVEAFPLRRP